MTPSPEKDSTGQPQSAASTLPSRNAKPPASPFAKLPSPNGSLSQILPRTNPFPVDLEEKLSHSVGGLAAANARSASTSRTRSLQRSLSSASTPSLPADARNRDNCRSIVRSFAPRIAVYASPDADDFVRQKGFTNGLCGLIRPFGERVQGKVVVRDSIGGSRAFDDYCVRICHPGSPPTPTAPPATGLDEQGSANGPEHAPSRQLPLDPLRAIEELLDQSVEIQSSAPLDLYQRSSDQDHPRHDQAATSRLFTDYLRGLLSSAPSVPHDTFTHPVTCLVAVSCRNRAPIDALRRLYSQTGRGNPEIPPWISTEYLRYYVLIHDEENDDIAKSTALFDLMKRHFGLHCHLLRLKGSQCVPSDDESTPVPACEWLPAEEELAERQAEGGSVVVEYLHRRADRSDSTAEASGPQRYVVESDAAAINALVREMVTQSVIPFMENRVMTWNDQVASRRRGISGRFMSLSKRWTGFGSSKSGNASSGGVGGPPGSNYDARDGFYPPDAPEAIMRQLADYAVMLRDWKLALSTYDAVRSDFGHDKAWAYHAAANEMAAVCSLLLPSPPSRSWSESVDQMLETAVYSHLTRCSSPFEAARCLTLGMELFQSRGSVGTDPAVKWAGRLLELGLIGPIPQTLTAERIAAYYMSRVDLNAVAQSPRRRQAALWNFLTVRSWDRLGRSSLARHHGHLASLLYGLTDNGKAGLPFPSMRPCWDNLGIGCENGSNTGASSLIDTTLDVYTAEESSLLAGADRSHAFASVPDHFQADDGGFATSSIGTRRTSRIAAAEMTLGSDGFE